MATCPEMAARGFLWLAANGDPEVTAVALAPDFGERYHDTIYNGEWRTEHFDDLDETAPATLTAPTVV